MTERMSCASHGVMTVDVVEESGSGFVRSHIIRKIIDADEESSQKGERKETRIGPEITIFAWSEQRSTTGATAMSWRSIPKSRLNFGFAAESGWIPKTLRSRVSKASPQRTLPFGFAARR